MKLTKFEPSKISNFQSPKVILEQFVTDLRFPFTQIRDLSATLLDVSSPNERKKKFSQLEQSASTIRENFTQVIDYLNARLRLREVKLGEEGNSTKLSEDNIAEALLADFSHELRAPVTSLIGFVTICQEYTLDQDRLEKYIGIIQNTAKYLEELFTDVEQNWETWVESRNFDWRKYNEAELLSPNQDELLQMAKEKFLDAGLSGDNEQKHSLYLQSSELFEQAIALGPIPENLVKFAEGSKRWAKHYSKTVS